MPGDSAKVTSSKGSRGPQTSSGTCLLLLVTRSAVGSPSVTPHRKPAVSFDRHRCRRCAGTKRHGILQLCRATPYYSHCPRVVLSKQFFFHIPASSSRKRKDI